MLPGVIIAAGRLILQHLKFSMKANAPGQSALLLLDIIPLLEKRRLSYAVIGAFAASFYGAIRASLDADAVISIKEKDIAPFMSEVQGLGLRISHDRGDARDPVRAVIRVEDAFMNRVDLLLGIRGVGEDVFSRVVNAQFMDASINIVGIEDFIVMKIFAGGLKDIADVNGVLAVSKEKVDLPLLKNLISKHTPKEQEQLGKLLRAHYYTGS